MANNRISLYPVSIEPRDGDCRARIVMMSGKDKDEVVDKIIGMVHKINPDMICNAFPEHNRSRVYVRTRKRDEEDWCYETIAIVYDLVETDEDSILNDIRRAFC